MKKNEHLVAKVALGTFAFVLGTTLVLNSWAEKTSRHNESLINKMEIDNTCGDLLEYIQTDLEEGRIDSIAFESYTWNIKDIKTRNNE
tara:strand:+ start:212 stop:475 length:264 start_codon:yes stop_codon:yes gene_type:complete